MQTEYHRDQIAQLAYGFMLLWPIGMPLLYLSVLLPNRKALRQRRRTPMVKATAFLHREYKTIFYW